MVYLIYYAQINIWVEKTLFLDDSPGYLAYYYFGSVGF